MGTYEHSRIVFYTDNNTYVKKILDRVRAECEIKEAKQSTVCIAYRDYCLGYALDTALELSRQIPSITISVQTCSEYAEFETFAIRGGEFVKIETLVLPCNVEIETLIQKKLDATRARAEQEQKRSLLLKKADLEKQLDEVRSQLSAR